MKSRVVHHILEGRPGWRAPVRARHSIFSVISSTDDLSPAPSPRLVDLALRAAQTAATLELTELASRVGPPVSNWINLWPGEHYRLLSALASNLGATTVVEIGTFTGLGALALRHGMPRGGRVVTYDITPWGRIGDTALRPGDFGAGLEQRIGNLAERSYFESQRELLESAQLFFIDGPKDGTFESALMMFLRPLVERSGALLVFDDTRVPNMLQFWRDLALPKLDLTSFGHWSGTGLAGRL